MKTAGDNGFVRTILGRKCRFNTWEPNMFRVGPTKALPRDEAEREYGKNIKRAWTYKALNKLIQGSAADQTKQAMLNLYKEGYITQRKVHDELNVYVPKEQMQTKKKAFKNQSGYPIPPTGYDQYNNPYWTDPQTGQMTYSPPQSGLGLAKTAGKVAAWAKWLA